MIDICGTQDPKKVVWEVQPNGQRIGFLHIPNSQDLWKRLPKSYRLEVTINTVRKTNFLQYVHLWDDRDEVQFIDEEVRATSVNKGILNK